jgi:hypothetical protein
MCGIVAVVRRPGRRAAPDLTALTAELAAAVALLAPDLGSTAPDAVVGSLARAAGRVAAVDGQLRGTAGLRALLAPGAAVDGIEQCARELDASVLRIERFLDAEGFRFGSDIECGAIGCVRRARWPSWPGPTRRWPRSRCARPSRRPCRRWIDWKCAAAIRRASI